MCNIHSQIHFIFNRPRVRQVIQWDDAAGNSFRHQAHRIDLKDFANLGQELSSSPDPTAVRVISC